MKFGSFKLGKSKEKELASDEAAAELTEEAVPEIPLDAEPVRPHTPLQELSLDSTEGAEPNSEVALDEEGVVRPKKKEKG